MSATIFVGFFLFWCGIGLAAIAFRTAMATPTRGEALVWFSTGVFGGSVLLLIAATCGYSPPGSSTIAAYVILACVIGLAVEIWRKPIEGEATDGNSHQG